MQPKTLTEFIEILRDLPEDILSQKERMMIVAAMEFKNLRVSDVMTPREKVAFVNIRDFLGPLTLDRLYRSGTSMFPVVDETGRQVIGTISVDRLNSLEIREMIRRKNIWTRESVISVRIILLNRRRRRFFGHIAFSLSW